MELVNTWSDQCFSVAVYLNIKSGPCNWNQQREVLRRRSGVERVFARWCD